MRRNSTNPIAFFFIPLVLPLLTTCSFDTDHGNRSLENTITVFAASSLNDAFEELAQQFQAQNHNVEIQLVFAGSSRLSEQILDGSPATVFASADHNNIKQIQQAGLITQTSSFASNHLELAVPVENPAKVESLADLTKPDLLVGLCAKTVPCGSLSYEALQKAGIAKQVADGIDTEETSVRSLLAKIETSELDAGIVYASDVKNSNKVKAIADPVLHNTQNTYYIALIKQSSNPTEADEFITFTTSPAGQSILQKHGFKRP